jgi:hypothetical protein
MSWSWLSNWGSAPLQTSPGSSRRAGRRGRGLRKRFQPAVMALEDRTVPTGLNFLGGSTLPTFPLPPTGAATHLQVIAPLSVVAGQTFKVVVIAETASNLPATGFSDTVVLSSSDPTATGNDNGPEVSPGPAALVPLPLTYTFNPLIDHGFHVFDVNLTMMGPQKITATDITDSTVAPGTAITTVIPAPALAQLQVVMPRSTTVGTPTPVTIVALDASGHPLINFTGTVSLSTSDKAATGLPSSYTFTAPNFGFHTFKVTFETPDTSPTPTAVLPLTTVTATDGSITNTASIYVAPASTLARFAIFALGPTVAGRPTPVIVAALNAANQIIPNYSGTVTFSSSDMTATASATLTGTQTPLSTFSYMFGATDGGLHVFYMTFGTPGKQTLTVSDSSAGVSNTTYVYVITTFAPKHGWWLF